MADPAGLLSYMSSIGSVLMSTMIRDQDGLHLDVVQHLPLKYNVYRIPPNCHDSRKNEDVTLCTHGCVPTAYTIMLL